MHAVARPSARLLLASPSWPRAALRVGVALAVLTLSSRLALPFRHTGVPFTLQGQAVLLVAATLGAREGVAAVLAWLGLAAAGAPVLALGAAGAATFVGPTAGYLASFPPVAWLVGRFGRGLGVGALVAWVFGNALTLALGTAYLATWVGWRGAVTAGLAPFVVADACKLAAVFAARHLACGQRRAATDARR